MKAIAYLQLYEHCIIILATIRLGHSDVLPCSTLDLVDYCAGSWKATLQPRESSRVARHNSCELDQCAGNAGSRSLIGGLVQQKQAPMRKQRREIQKLIAEARYDDLLELLEPAVAAEHLRLHGGDVSAAGKALCTPFPTRPLIESYVFGQAERVLRTLRFAGLIGSRQDLLERLKRTTVVLTD